MVEEAAARRKLLRWSAEALAVAGKARHGQIPWSDSLEGNIYRKPWFSPSNPINTLGVPVIFSLNDLHMAPDSAAF